MANAPSLRMQLADGGLVVAPGVDDSTVRACDDALHTLRETGAPPPAEGGPSIREAFRRSGSEEWDILRRQLGQAAVARAAA